MSRFQYTMVGSAMDIQLSRAVGQSLKYLSDNWTSHPICPTGQVNFEPSFVLKAVVATTSTSIRQKMWAGEFSVRTSENYPHLSERTSLKICYCPPLWVAFKAFFIVLDFYHNCWVWKVVLLASVIWYWKKNIKCEAELSALYICTCIQ